MVMRSGRVRWLCALVLLSGLARADEEQAKEAVFTLGEVSVTDVADPRAETTQAVVGQEELRLHDRATVSQAANLVPGVALGRSGARNESTLYVRGFDIKHLPIYLDGIPIYVPYDGYPDMGRFTTYDLSELVVSKGFTSVLYGPNTMGGALNLVSRRPSRALEGDVGLRLAAGPLRSVFGNVGTRQRPWYAQAGGSWEKSDGFPLPDGFKPVGAEDGGQRDNSYRRDWKGSAKVGFTPNATDEYVLSLSTQQGTKGTPPYAGYGSGTARFWRWPYWDKHSFYFNSHTALGEHGYLKTRLYYDLFKNSLWAYDDATYSSFQKRSSFKSHYDDYTCGGSIEAGSTLVPHNELKLAIHFKDDVHREANEPNPLQHFEDRLSSIGLEDTVRLGDAFTLVAGVSYDAVEAVRAQNYNATTKVFTDFPQGDTSAWNPQVGLFYKAPTGGVAHATVARKSRLPSIKDRYSYRLGTALPNPDLKPERSTNYELGYQDHLPGRVKVAATGFFNDVTDFVLLATVPDPSNPSKTLNQNQNLGKVRQVGGELELAAPVGTLAELGASYTWLKSDNRSNDQKITGIPDHKLAGYARLTPLASLSALVSGEYDSKRYSTSNGKDVAGGWFVVNAKLGWAPLRGLTLEAGVENLLDRQYALDEGFPEPGRTFFGQARHAF
jgi:iron complex outermembrane recepter protein